MADALDSENVILKPSSVIAEAWETLHKDWRLYLRWAAIPLLLFIVELVVVWSAAMDFSKILPQFHQLRSLSSLPQQEQLQHLQHLQHQIPAFTFSVIPFLHLLTILVFICYAIRVHRHVILGDMPNGNILGEIFSKRPWLYIGKHILLMFKWWLFAMLFMILGLVIMSVLFMVMRALSPQAEANSAAMGVFLIIQIAIACMVFILSFVRVAEQFALIGPDVAVDGKASLGRLHRLAMRHRGRIALTALLIVIVPILLLIGLHLALRADFRGAMAAVAAGQGNAPDPAVDFSQALELVRTQSGAKFILLGVLDIVFSIGAWALLLFAFAVIYKRLCPAWPAMDAAEQESAGPGGQPGGQSVGQPAGQSVGQSAGQSGGRFTPGLPPESPESPEPLALPVSGAQPHDGNGAPSPDDARGPRG